MCYVESMDKKESLRLKAFALMLMLWHHLFGCNWFLTNGEEFTYVQCFGKYDVILGQGSKLCIALFAFASGYGMYRSYIDNARYKKIWGMVFKFLIQYWIIMIFVAIPYLIMFDKFQIKYFFINLFALLHNDEILYVSLSWYVKVNLLFLLVCPIVKWLSNKYSYVIEVLLGMVLPMLVTFSVKDVENDYAGAIPNFLSTIKLLCTWFPLFYTGIAFSKYDVFEKLNKYRGKEKSVLGCFAAIALMLGAILVRYKWGWNTITDIFCAVVFVIGFDYLNDKLFTNNRVIDKVLCVIGKYSFQLWLLSGMFYLNTTEYTWLLYKPKYSILIFAWNIIILLPLAFVTQKIALSIYKFLENLLYKISSLCMN